MEDDDVPKDILLCSFCHKSKYTLYEGWFRYEHSLEPFFQLKRACRTCLEKCIKNGTALAKEIPSQSQS